ESRDLSGNPTTATLADVIVRVLPPCPTCPMPTITVPATATGKVGTPLSLPITATHPTPGTALTILSQSLPSGASLTPASGAASQAGIPSFVARDLAVGDDGSYWYIDATAPGPEGAVMRLSGTSVVDSGARGTRIAVRSKGEAYVVNAA